MKASGYNLCSENPARKGAITTLSRSKLMQEQAKNTIQPKLATKHKNTLIDE